jgi:hypothetical protein
MTAIRRLLQPRNLDGRNVHLTMATMVVAQALNLDLSLEQPRTILAMLTSKGASEVRNDVTTVIVSRWEGERNRRRLREELGR